MCRNRRLGERFGTTQPSAHVDDSQREGQILTGQGMIGIQSYGLVVHGGHADLQFALIGTHVQQHTGFGHDVGRHLGARHLEQQFLVTNAVGFGGRNGRGEGVAFS